MHVFLTRGHVDPLNVSSAWSLALFPCEKRQINSLVRNRVSLRYLDQRRRRVRLQFRYDYRDLIAMENERGSPDDIAGTVTRAPLFQAAAEIFPRLETKECASCVTDLVY